MTDKEKAIVMAHTGICMLTGDKFQIFHKYVEDIMGRPIMTHEIGFLADAIKEKAKADFIALCTDESGSEKPNKSGTKINCDNADCNNCVNHKYCDYESNKSEIPTGSTTKKDCNTCTHSNEIDGSNCYECVKGICNNY